MSFKDKVAYLRERIRLSLPDLDTSPPSVVRVLIDAFSEMSAQADIAEDQAIDWDINNKVGRELDDFVGIFGFSRIPATQASGSITMRFAGHTSRSNIIKEGTRVYGYRAGGSVINYRVETDTGIPAFSSAVTIPIVAEGSGSKYNARPGEIRHIDFVTDSILNVVNETHVSGGKPSENDEELRRRFQADLFRNNVSTEDYYRSIALRHPRTAAVQLIKPRQETEEHLQIVGGSVQCQEDSLSFTYPSDILVYNVNRNIWLEETQDYNTVVDNETPKPPQIIFLPGGKWDNDESVLVRYGYSSVKSRNNPTTNDLYSIDIYVSGQQPLPLIDLSFWAQENEVGSGFISSESHPGAREGDRYYIFARQPVIGLHPEMNINGRSYKENRDYYLVKDRSRKSGSSQAKDMICWKGGLPATLPGQGRPGEPAFRIPYFHESIVSEIQEVLDEPSVRGATDDVLVHSTEHLTLDIDLTIEWDGGNEDLDSLEESIISHFSQVEMGSRVKIGELMRVISNTTRVAAVFLEEIRTPKRIRGRQSFQSDIPLPDGEIPMLGKLTVKKTAPNVYTDRSF